MKMGGQAAVGMLMGSGTCTTPFPQPGPEAMRLAPTEALAKSSVRLEPSNPVTLHVGPQVVVQVAARVSDRLNDPGAGLSDNGRRVLTYADLRARFRGVDGRSPTREIE